MQEIKFHWSIGISLIGTLLLERVFLPMFAGGVPDLMLMTLSHWALYRPDLVPPLFIVGCGIAMDVLCGYPLGGSAFLFLFAFYFIVLQRQHFIGHSFYTIWTAIYLFLFLMNSVKSLGLWLIWGHGATLRDLLWQSTVSALLYPLWIRGLIRFSKWTLSER